MKQILLINDLVGYGKMGMGAMMPILTHMGVSSYYLPTALVSNNLAYNKFAIQENTDYIRQTFEVWSELGFGFDAVCTGLMFSKQQAEMVADWCAKTSANGTTIFVDPIMADSGKLYNGVAPSQVEAMRRMVSVADLIFPNYTEACFLTGTPYNSQGITWDEAQRMLDALVKIGCKSALITSCRIEGRPAVCGFGHHSGQYFSVPYEVVPGVFDGTGDIFSAILIGHLLCAEGLQVATQAAVQTIYRIISRYSNKPDDKTTLPIEQCLDLL